MPPQCRAKRRQQTAAIMSTIPAPSNDLTLFRNVPLCCGPLASIRRNNRINTKDTAPIGKFLRGKVLSVRSTEASDKDTYIQKHHLQVTRSVKIPPKGGSKHTATPKTLKTTPRNNGRFSNFTVSPTILNAPWYKPAAPMPAIARPAMKTADVGPEADITDPTFCMSASVNLNDVSLWYLQMLGWRSNRQSLHRRTYRHFRKRVEKPSLSVDTRNHTSQRRPRL